MKRWMMLLAAMMLAFAVHAEDSVRFGSKVVTVGDSEAKVYQVAGQPTLRVRLETKYGGADGYRLDYVTGRKTVQIYIDGGRVSNIEEIFN